MAKKASKSQSNPVSEESGSEYKQIRFMNAAQQACWEMIDASKVCLITGPAGTSKSHLCTSWAVSAVAAKRYGRFILTRPTVEAGEGLGYLPGDLLLKLEPYNAPIFAIMKKLGCSFPVEQLPLAFLRGHTFENCVAFLDEAQNCNVDSLKLYLTRMGRNSKLLIAGDSAQSDIEYRRDGQRSGLEYIISRLEGLPGVGVFRFGADDCVRDPMVKAMLARIE
jgi:phosphate starvation-inducible protein PhoH and related proteins